MILFALANLFLEDGVTLLFRHICDILLDGLFFVLSISVVLQGHLADEIDVLGMFAQDSIKVTGWIAAQQNVGTATGHVGSDGNASAAPGLGHDLRLAVVVLGVKNVVGDALHVQYFGKMLRNFNRGDRKSTRLN